MAVVAVLMLGFFAFLIMRASSPQMAPLYSDLSFEDSSAIVAELQTQNVPFELRSEGETILVARDQITTLRMALAENGLPQRGQVGYEIFDQQNTLGATSFVQNINNLRALEGELARTITSLARIKSARVHLVLPERELFRRERKDPTASIMLAVRGELSGGEIRAIQHLVASAVEGMTPGRVSVVDGTGRLLASGAGDDDSIIAGENVNITTNFVQDTPGQPASSDASTRATTTAEVPWTDATAWAETEAKQTPDISTVVQEVVNIEGWAGDVVILVRPANADAAGDPDVDVPGRAAVAGSTSMIVEFVPMPVPPI